MSTGAGVLEQPGCRGKSTAWSQRGFLAQQEAYLLMTFKLRYFYSTYIPSWTNFFLLISIFPSRRLKGTPRPHLLTHYLHFLI